MAHERPHTGPRKLGGIVALDRAWNFNARFKLLVESVKAAPELARAPVANVDPKPPCTIGLDIAPGVLHPTEIPRLLENSLPLQIVVFSPQFEIALRLVDDPVEHGLSQTAELGCHAGIGETDISRDEQDWARVVAFHAPSRLDYSRDAQAVLGRALNVNGEALAVETKRSVLTGRRRRTRQQRSG